MSDSASVSLQPSASDVEAPKTYLIGGVVYRLEPASFAQHEWLAAGPLKSLDFSVGLTAADFEPIIQRHGTEILGIVLLAEGQTREQKALGGLVEAQALGARLKCLMTPSEVRAIAHDFFTIDGFRNLWFFIDFPALVARTKAAAIVPASSPASASLPMVPGPSAPPSADSVGRETVNLSSGEASSGAPLNAPSLVSAG